MTACPRWGGVAHRREYGIAGNVASENVGNDLQSVASHVNAQGTSPDLWHKSDTGSSLNVPQDMPEMENPGALAGATGAVGLTKQPETVDDLAAEYRLRHEWAITLAYAIENAHPDDALSICCGVVERLRRGSPLPPLLEIEDEARWWASMATPFELLAYLQACLAHLTDEAVKLNTRKRLLVKLWDMLPAADRQAFLARVDPQGAFVRGAA